MRVIESRNTATGLPRASSTPAGPFDRQPSTDAGYRYGHKALCRSEVERPDVDDQTSSVDYLSQILRTVGHPSPMPLASRAFPC